MRIGQVAYTYKPLIGGCETYIETLRILISHMGHSQRIYQIKREGLHDRHIKQVPVFKLFKRKPLYIYNLLLNTQLLSLAQEDILIVHDPFHFWPVFWHKSIVISHGVRWDRPQKSEALYNKVHLLSARFSMKFAHTIVANDTNFYRKLGIKLKPKERMFSEVIKNRWVIPNCVDTDYFKKTKPLPSLQQLRPILVPRNIVRGRGIHLAIDAYKEFSKHITDTNLVICGDFADPVYKNEIFQQTKQLGLIGKVFFLGSIDWKEMPTIYSSSIMSVVPTLYEEGTSLAALESMSCGTPVVSTNVGGLADLPTLQSLPTAKELAKKMVECFKNREQLSLNQMKETRKVYNLTNFKDAWGKVINS